MGSLWEFGSYATRTISTRNQQNSGLALISQILILLAPICKLHLVSLYEYAILTPASYQRIRLHYSWENGALLPSILLRSWCQALQPHTVVRLRRYCLLCSSAHWRCPGDEYRPSRSSLERNPHLYGWYFSSGNLHHSVRRLCSSISHAAIKGGENRAI